MKNRYVGKLIGKRMLAVALCAVMVTTTLTGCKTTSSEKIPEEEAEAAAEQEAELESILSENAGIHTETDNGNPAKEETVYVLADAYGNANEVIVSDWIKNAQASDSIEDVSTLKDIKNTDGDEIYLAGDNGQLHWQSLGNDIHYQGISEDTSLPVDVKITYYLEGEEVGPEEIAGKNGNVKIRFDYTNHETMDVTINGKDETIYLPFAMISGMVLPSDKFSNVKVTNGRVVTQSGNNVVVGMAFPGLSDSLNVADLKEKAKDNDLDNSEKIDDFEVPDYVEVTAYTTDFEMDQTMTVAVTDILSAIDTTSNRVNTDGVKDSMDELSDASKKLSDGTIDLADGAKKLMDGAFELNDKAKELDDGASDLNDGAKELNDGAGDLLDGVVKLDDGASALAEGSGTLKDGTHSLLDGMIELEDGSWELKKGTAQLREGYEGGDGALAGAKKLSDGMAQLNEAVKGSAIPTLSDDQKTQIGQAGAEGAKGYAATFAGGIAGLGGNPGVCDQIAGSISSKKSAIVSQTKSAVAGSIGDNPNMASAVSTLEGMGMTEDQAKNFLGQVAGAAAEAAAAGVVDSVSASVSSDDTKTTVAGGLATSLESSLGQLGSGLAVQTAESIMGSVGGALGGTMATLGEATQQLSDGSAALYEGLGKLYAGTVQVDDGVSKLGTGIGTAREGAGKLDEGAQTLKNGICTLKDGTVELRDGSGKLKDGTQELFDGTVDLKDGTLKFLDGTGELYDGTTELSDGSIELMDGMLKFDEEGISKLTDIFGNDVDDVVQRIRTVVDAGKEYTIYTKAPTGMDSSVKFVYKTDAVKSAK